MRPPWRPARKPRAPAAKRTPLWQDRSGAAEAQQDRPTRGGLAGTGSTRSRARPRGHDPTSRHAAAANPRLVSLCVGGRLPFASACGGMGRRSLPQRRSHACVGAQIEWVRVTEHDGKCHWYAVKALPTDRRPGPGNSAPHARTCTPHRQLARARACKPAHLARQEHPRAWQYPLAHARRGILACHGTTDCVLRFYASRYNKRTGLSTFHKPSCIGTRADKEAGNDMAWLDGLQAGSNVLSSNRVI
jgi:hypothetical protein